MSKRRPGAFRAFFFVLFCMFVSISLLVGAAWFSYAKTQQLTATKMRNVAIQHQEAAIRTRARTVPARAAYSTAEPSYSTPARPTLSQSSQTQVQSLPLNSNYPVEPNRSFQQQANPFGQPRLLPVNENSDNSFIAKIKNAKDDDAKQEAIDQAKEALEKHYDDYVDKYEKQVKEMEERVTELRKQLDKRKSARDRLVEMKLESITNQADGFGWPDDNSQPNGVWSNRNQNIFQPQPVNPFGQPGYNNPSNDQPRATSGYSNPSRDYTRAYGNMPSQATGYNNLSPRRSGHNNQTGNFSFDAPQSQNSGNSFNSQPGTRDRSRQPLPPGNGPITFVKPLNGSQNLVFSLELSGYFQHGIDLLEADEYGQFLLQFMEPDKFREAISSNTLEEVSEAFENGKAESILRMFIAASKDSTRKRKKETKTLTWNLEIDGGEVVLTLTRTDFQLKNDFTVDRWYIKTNLGLERAPAVEDQLEVDDDNRIKNGPFAGALLKK